MVPFPLGGVPAGMYPAYHGDGKGFGTPKSSVQPGNDLMANFEGGGVAVQTCSRARNNADIVTSRSINFEIIAETFTALSYLGSQTR